LLKNFKNTDGYKICHELANASKHFIITPKKEYLNVDTSVKQGWGAGRWGKGKWGEGEETIDILVNDKKISILELSINVMEAYGKIFTGHCA